MRKLPATPPPAAVPAKPTKPKRHPWRTYNNGYFGSRITEHRALPSSHFRVIRANGRPG